MVFAPLGARSLIATSCLPFAKQGLSFAAWENLRWRFICWKLGCTDAEVSAITGQSRQMVEHYARQVNQKKLAAAAVLKWEMAAAA